MGCEHEMGMYMGNDLVEPHERKGSQLSMGRPPGWHVGRGLRIRKGTRKCGTAISRRLSLSQPQHTDLCPSILKFTTFCLNTDGYLFIKLSWNSNSAISLSSVFLRKKIKNKNNSSNNKQTKQTKNNQKEPPPVNKKNLHRQAIMRYSWLAVCSGTWFPAM